jgi:hypothetical protein
MGGGGRLSLPARRVSEGRLSGLKGYGMRKKALGHNNFERINNRKKGVKGSSKKYTVR